MASFARDSSPRSIAGRLIATREALGLNQRQFCTRAKIASNTYNQWEKGKRPGLDEALKLCGTYKLTLDWIYLGDPSCLPYALALKLQDTSDPSDPESSENKLVTTAPEKRHAKRGGR